ncbi:MAG: S-4TM family putative pore-forming effector [Ktedonobacteraceae bacterium]
MEGCDKKKLPIEEVEKKSRNLQDKIYYNRRSNPFILNWIYRRLLRKNEEFMIGGAEELVTEALHSLGKSSNP